MTLVQEQQVLVELEKCLMPNGIAFVELFYMANSAADAFMPGIGTQMHLGMVRSERPAVRKYKLKEGEAFDIFGKEVVYTDGYGRWRYPPNREFEFVLNVAYLPSVHIVGKMDAKKRKTYNLMRSVELWEKIPKGGMFTILRDPGIGRVLRSDIYTDEGQIAEELSSENPVDSANAYDMLQLPIPKNVLTQLRETVTKDLKELYRLSKEDHYVAKPHIENLVKFLRERNVTSFMQESELRQGIKINVEEFLKGLERDFDLELKQN